MAVDLNLLTHLSDRALANEAQKRGLNADGKSRDTLIHEIQTYTPPKAPPTPAVTSPTLSSAVSTRPIVPTPTPRQSRQTPIGRARAFLGQVMGLARAALRTTPITEPIRDELPRTHEPIRTRTLAELLVEQGQLERAIGIYRDLSGEHASDPEIRKRLLELEHTLHQRIVKQAASDALKQKEAPFLEVLERGEARCAIWKLDDHTLKRGHALIDGDSVLTLRIVKIRRGPDHSVENMQTDRDDIGSEGRLLLEETEKNHMIISIGLKSPDDFVSMLHRKHTPGR